MAHTAIDATRHRTRGQAQPVDQCQACRAKWGWTPTPAAAQRLFWRSASWTPSTCEDIRRELADAASIEKGAINAVRDASCRVDGMGRGEAERPRVKNSTSVCVAPHVAAVATCVRFALGTAGRERLSGVKLACELGGADCDREGRWEGEQDRWSDVVHARFAQKYSGTEASLAQSERAATWEDVSIYEQMDGTGARS